MTAAVVRCLHILILQGSMLYAGLVLSLQCGNNSHSKWDFEQTRLSSVPYINGEFSSMLT